MVTPCRPTCRWRRFRTRAEICKARPASGPGGAGQCSATGQSARMDHRSARPRTPIRSSPTPGCSVTRNIRITQKWRDAEIGDPVRPRRGSDVSAPNSGTFRCPQASSTPTKRRSNKFHEPEAMPLQRELYSRVDHGSRERIDAIHRGGNLATAVSDRNRLRPNLSRRDLGSRLVHGRIGRSG